MQIIVEAKENVNQVYGDAHLEAKEGEKLTLSLKDAEIALATGNFEFVKEVSETDAEKERLVELSAEQDARRAELLELSHEKLYEQAKDLPGVKKSMRKEELVDELLKPRAPATADAQTTPKGDEDQ
jgi:hypothetical protein